MWKRKKFIVIAVLAAVVVAGSIGGVVFAQAGDGDDCSPGVRHEALMSRVCEIYEENTGAAIDQEALKGAFTHAWGEMRSEAMQHRQGMCQETPQNRLQNLVEQGKITQEQADEFQEWWQSRPDAPDGFGFRGMGRPPFDPAE